MSLKLYFFSLAIITSVVCFSESKKENMNPPEQPSFSSKEIEINYLALGDSYTKAECELPTNAYPFLLSEHLKKRGFVIREQKTIAQTGWRTDDLKNAINHSSPQDNYDIVSLLIGVNDQYQGKSLEVYKTNFIDLVTTAIKLAKGRHDKVFILSIPDYGVTPFGSAKEASISSQIDVFNTINKAIADSMNILYFDVTSISRQAKTNTSLTCHDDLHPSALMYQKWIDLILEDVVMLVRKP